MSHRHMTARPIVVADIPIMYTKPPWLRTLVRDQTGHIKALPVSQMQIDQAPCLWSTGPGSLGLARHLLCLTSESSRGPVTRMSHLWYDLIGRTIQTSTRGNRPPEPMSTQWPNRLCTHEYTMAEPIV